MRRSTEEISTTESLSELFENHADRVYGYAFKHCGQRSLAEEVTAQAFEAASQRFSGGYGHQVTLPWLFTVARRRLIDHWRAEARRSDRLSRLRNEVLARANAEPPEESGVLRALDALPTHHRAALTLRYLDEFSVNEVADQLELSYKAAESLLSRARRAFSIAYWEQR